MTLISTFKLCSKPLKIGNDYKEIKTDLLPVIYHNVGYWLSTHKGICEI